MKVIYLNHTGRMSGAERSLLELLSALPDDVSPLVAAPEGDFAKATRALGVTVRTVPAAEASLRLHPVHTPRALAGFAHAALAVARLARREGADLVHAATVRAGLVSSLARRIGGPPAVVFVRDCLPPTRVGSMTRRAILAGRPIVLANSEYTAASFAAGRGSAHVRTIYNGMVDDSGRLVSVRGADPPGRAEARRRLGLDESERLLGLVAQITPWKGQDTAIEALVGVRREFPDARLLLVGEAKFTGPGTRYDNAAYLARLRARIEALGLGESVEFLGERRDALEIIAALDVLLAPSWEEPFGRTIVEAMAIGTPVVATAVGGPAEIIDDGDSGLLVPPREPGRLTRAVLELLQDPELSERIQAEGRRAAGRFTLAAHVDGVLGAYRSLVGSGAASL